MVTITQNGTTIMHDFWICIEGDIKIGLQHTLEEAEEYINAIERINLHDGRPIGNLFYIIPEIKIINNGR